MIVMTEQLRFRCCRQNVGVIEQRKKSGFTLNSHHESFWKNLDSRLFSTCEFRRWKNSSTTIAIFSCRRFSRETIMTIYNFNNYWNINRQKRHGGFWFFTILKSGNLHFWWHLQNLNNSYPIRKAKVDYYISNI